MKEINSTSARDVDSSDSPFEDGCDAEVGRRFDIDAIKDAVTIHDVLGLDAATKSIECPIHQGARKSFSIWGAGRAYTCHADCGETGDVITLWQRLHGVTARAAIEALAALAEVEPGTASVPRPRRPPRTKPAISPRDPRLRSAMLAWDALRTGRADADERDDLTWAEREYRSRNRGRLLAEAAARGMAYLTSRGLGGLRDTLGVSGPFYYLCFRPDGSPSTPIYTRERISVYRTAAMINIATRIIAPSATGPKVLVMANHPTKFCFGRVDPLLVPLERVVLVEGVMDYLTALLLWPPGRTLTCGGTLVLGAHSVGQVVPIIQGLLDDDEIGPRFRRLPLTLVPHADPAGAKTHAMALALCALHAVNATTFDLAGCGDLNEWICR